MSETNNNLTIESYDGHLQEYIDSTPQEVSGSVKEWLDQTFSGIAKNARILELGSGFGRDAAYLQAQGYVVECSDATPAFVGLLRQRGFNVRQLNALTDEIPSGVDVVLANAVLLHFTRDEVAHVASKVHKALKPGGTFAFSLKQGEGEGWSEAKLGVPRFFCYWDPHPIRNVLNVNGFKKVDILDNRSTEHATWLQIIAKKQEV